MLNSYVNSFAVKILLQFGNANLTEVEDACSKCGVAFSVDECVAEMLLLSCASRCYDRDAEFVA